ncbi:protein prenyltransferase alpha subunit repeat-containing protein 1-B isoform X2 [Prunus persica]|uniref:protein prenyltransferase alpha subunit repeat-containing protein 1-B isoform X2 n=1 Tax=Prunus persica TaxID=3760 RepID=UPI0009AB54F5|nr:protein prenyltransferase alpha subunit repeat-containing protein 1-B isoform X2 [Prunus persica]
MENCCLGAPSLCQFCLRSLQLSSGNKKGVNGNIKGALIFSNQQSDDFNLYGLTSLHERPRRGNRNQSDEVGFVHPSQFFKLNEEAGHSLPSSDSTADENSVFWNEDHKLGISTQVLLPLYKASKDAFMTANRQFKELNSTSDVSGAENSLCTSLSLDDSIESAIMKHSRALLLLSCDFGTAWHSRKIVVLEKHKLSSLLDELLLSALVLSYSPKSEYAWSHRKWVIKSISEKCSTLPEIVTKESELVEKIAEKSKMNYRAWNHRCWLVSYMTREQLLHELKRSRNWANLHVADHSCFHYRSLMLKILEDRCYEQEISSSGYSVEIYLLWKDELDWDEMLIKRYIGREALWLHRRFLSLFWIKHFLTDHTGLSGHGKQKTSMNNDFSVFMDNELHLLHSCSIIPDNSFDDYQAQAMHSATYMLWLIKQIPDSCRIELQEKLKTENLKALLNKVCPERSSTWDCLMGYVEASDH